MTILGSLGFYFSSQNCYFFQFEIFKFKLLFEFIWIAAIADMFVTFIIAVLGLQ